MLSCIRNGWLLTAALVITVSLTTSPALAHDHRHVGDYNFVVGFMIEPAYEGLVNGVDLRVTKLVSEETGHGHGSHHAPRNEQPNERRNEQGTASGHGMSIDVESHGLLFSSPGLTYEGAFSFVPGHDLEGTTIPYHNQLDHDMTGTIAVKSEGHSSGDLNIDIRDSMFMPADVTVGPGTKLVWTNRSSLPQSVTSGLAPAEDHADGEMVEAPVEGLQETLGVEITHVPTGESRVLDLTAVADQPGHYTAGLIPTAQGVYRMRVFGTIEGTEVDETFESYGGGGGFSDILPASALQFPVQLPEVREIEGAVRGALTTAQQAQDVALSAQAASANGGASSGDMLGIIGVALGTVGTLAGVIGLTVAMRKR